MNHGELVERAARWLANTKRCSVVITEMAAGGEEPDAIGWRGAHSTLVECKMTRADFNADKRKVGRRRGEALGKGDARYYLVPRGLLDCAAAMAPEKWGILIAHKTRVEVRRESARFEANKPAEMEMLISAIRRIAGKRCPFDGANIACYKIEGTGHPRATLGAMPEGPRHQRSK